MTPLMPTWRPPRPCKKVVDFFNFHLWERTPLPTLLMPWLTYSRLSIYRDRYKDLVSVYRHPKNDSIAIGSKIFEIKSLEGEGKLFSNDSRFNFCYLIVDQKKDSVKVWYSQFVPFW